MKSKLKKFFTSLIKNKTFWICFGVVLLSLVITWCCLAPNNGNDPSETPAMPISKITAIFIVLFIILALGYLLGRITIKGISFGTAGIFLLALGVGAILSIPQIKETIFIKTFYIDLDKAVAFGDILENFGLILFVSAVGYIAGPTFFRNFKSNAKCYIAMGIIVTIIGVALTAAIGVIPGIGKYYASGIFSGAITSTPALAAAQEVATTSEAKSLITIGYAITYPLGVLGVVLFIQFMPRLLKVNISDERGRLIIKTLKTNIEKEKESERKAIIDDYHMFEIDSYGLFPFSLAVVLGLLVGTITIPLTTSGYSGPCFSLGTTGGCLLSCIIFGHFGHIGQLSFNVPLKTNKTLRELGLAIFLAGIGIVGGYRIVDYVGKGIITGTMILSGILLGILITVIPMVIGFYVGKYVFKLPILNNLGSITGSMTSTPALGSLIDLAKTDDVAVAYASAFPIATILTTIGMSLYLNIAV